MSFFRRLVPFCLLAGLSSCGGASEEMPPLPEPVQVDVEPVRISPGMTKLADFSSRVLVLSRREYPSDPSDVLSGASPLDLAVAWGPAASEDAREAVELTQSDRRYHWRARESDMATPGVGDFTRHSGNWHMVPADAEIAAALAAVKPGDVVSMEGELVLLTFPDGTYYASSLSREDTGDGACEIFRVRSISVS
jgi:hypothetical protein